MALLAVAPACVGCAGAPGAAPSPPLQQRHYEPPRRSVALRRPRPPGRAASAGLVVRVTARETWVRREASSRARHLGVVRRGARMRSLGLVPGAGCAAGWHRLAVGGFLCAEEVAVTSEGPGGLRHPQVPRGALLPYRYVGVHGDGSGEYLQPEDAASDYFLRELAPHNALTVTGRIRADGEWFWRTTRGTYVPAAEVVPLRASAFQGQRLGGAWRLPLAFVHGRRALRHRAPGRPSGGFLPHYHRAAALPAAGRRPARWVALADGSFVRRGDVRLAVASPPPPGVGPQDPWIDVDVAEQVLVAYRGAAPVFATLVSTGRSDRTPLGTYRVWVKLAATDMRSGPRESGRPYQLWDVPWTVFFKGDFALHGTYWHDRFGHRKSAGCVNLSPRDARFVFGFVAPALPPGWWAVLPHRPEAGSLVRVRDSRARPRRPRTRRYACWVNRPSCGRPSFWGSSSSRASPAPLRRRRPRLPGPSCGP